MTLTIHDQLEQGSEEWRDLRRGIITASVAGRLITTKTRKPADNIATRALTLALIAERITGYTDESDGYASEDMIFGAEIAEPAAVQTYSEHYAPARPCGFMVEDRWGFEIGYSPDGLVGGDGLVEVKSRRQKKHLQTILADEVPVENMAQIQCGLLVSDRAWCDYVSYCGGMPLFVKRVFPDPVWFDAITAACVAFEQNAARIVADYRTKVAGMPMTERLNFDLEMVI